MRRSWFGVIASLLVLPGCVYIPVGSLPQFDSAQLASGSASLRVALAIQPGGYRSQALILPYAEADVEHLLVSVYKLSGGSEVAVVDTVNRVGEPLVRDLDRTALGAGLALENLAHNTTYRVRVRAYKAAGQAEADRISDDATSFVDVAVGTDDRPANAAVPVVLVDRLFSGQSTTSFTFIDGMVRNAATESIQ